MHRRDFMALVGGGILLSSTRLRSEHHVVSPDPLVVEFDLSSLHDRYTPVEDFYVRNHFDIPRAAGVPGLRVEGQVEKAVTLAREDLAHLPERELGAVLECAGNGVGTMGLVSNGSWTGWRLAEVLSLARPAPQGSFLHLFGADGYCRSVPIERASSGLIVARLNRRPLTPKHGAPWRAVFTGWYGMDSVKWLERIVVAPTPLAPVDNTYLELIQRPSGEVDRSPLPRVQVKSIILDPVDGAVLRRQRVEVHGLAWSGSGAIASVELSTDGGKNWQAANLQHAGTLEWATWKSSVELTSPGVVEFACRAKDERGGEQAPERDPVRRDGYANNWYHRVRCVVSGQ